jgi:hypothetical protein
MSSLQSTEIIVSARGRPILHSLPKAFHSISILFCLTGGQYAVPIPDAVKGQIRRGPHTPCRNRGVHELFQTKLGALKDPGAEFSTLQT